MVDAVVNVSLEKVNDSIRQINSNYNQFKNEIDTLGRMLLSTKNILHRMEKRTTNNYYLEKTRIRLSVFISEYEKIFDEWQAEPSDKIDYKSSFVFLDQLKHSSKRFSEIFKEIFIIQQNLEEFHRKFMQPNEKENNKTVSRPSSSLNVQENAIRLSKRYSLYARIHHFKKLRTQGKFSSNTGHFRESSSLEEQENFEPIQFQEVEIVPLDDDVNEIIDWLQDLDTGYMIGFVQKGWHEKNIANIVFHDKRCEAMYEKKIWISVSQNVDGKNIMKDILSFFEESCEHYDYAHLLTQIEHHLKGKKYLLVLDDVGKDVSWWKKLRVGLPKESGGRVIITSWFQDTVIRMGDDNSLIYNFDEKSRRRIYQQIIKAFMPITEQKDNNTVSRCTSPLFIEYQIVGLDDDVNKIINWLQDLDRGYMIGIVGMAGLGKTTIAQMVYKRCEATYEKRIWVCISQDFKLIDILKSILGFLKESCEQDDYALLHMKINQCLTGRKYLLVFDDVWSDVSWWKNLQAGFPMENGSRVIITSRDENTVKKMGVHKSRIHKPNLLTSDQSWSLLYKTLSTPNLNSEMIKVGHEIAEGCAGLPLAIKAIGERMRSKPQTIYSWKEIAKNPRQELESNDNPIDVSLQLSYNELPVHLESCFLSFSLYPKNCTILKDQLLKWWIGEGFIRKRENKTETELAEEYFMKLIDRCLIEVVERSYNREVHTCKIHDMVHGFVIQIAKEEKFYEPNLKWNRRLGLHSVGINRPHAQTKLRALISTTRIDEVKEDIPSNLGFNCGGSYCLRVLDLSRMKFNGSFKHLWDQIKKFRNLTYLSFKRTNLENIDDSIKNLKKLQILDVSSCPISNLSFRINTLTTLTILDVSNCGSLEYLPKGLGELIHLEVLKGFRLSTYGCRLEDLRNLNNLRTLELEIARDDLIEDNEFDVLSTSLKELKFLTISCGNGNGDELVNKIDNLILPEGIHDLSLIHFPGKESPRWLSPNSLPNLEFLSISKACFTRMNESFWVRKIRSWNIIGLRIEFLSDLVMTWSEIQKAMPSLQILEARECPNLNTFPIDNIQGGMWRKEVCPTSGSKKGKSSSDAWGLVREDPRTSIKSAQMLKKARVVSIDNCYFR